MPEAATPIQRPDPPKLSAFFNGGTSKEFVEPTSFLSEEERVEIKKEDSADVAESEKPQAEESEVEEVDDAASEEAPEVKKTKKKEEITLELPEITERQKALIELKEEPPAPVSEEHAFNHYKTQVLFNHLRSQGVDLKDDGSNFQTVMNQIAKEAPADYHSLVQWADKIATQETAKYKAEKIVPFAEYQIAKQVNTFVERYIQLIPDVAEYFPTMVKLAPLLTEKFPEFRQNVASAIPFLYQMAKEKRLKQGFTTVAKADKKVTLESGGARRQKAVKDKPVDKAQQEIDAVFGQATPQAQRDSKLLNFLGRAK